MDHGLDLYSLEGNIGSGKTTLLSLLPQIISTHSLKTITQPVDRWRQVGLNKTNVLQEFYQDSQRWAFPFQILTLFTRLQKLTQQCKGSAKCFLSERSMEGDLNIFAKEMVRSGLFSQPQIDVYTTMYESYLSLFKNLGSKGFIYLRTSPEVCFKRLLGRKRPEEATISLGYLQELHGLHEEWLRNETKPVLQIDGDQDLLNDKAAREKVVGHIASFLNL